MRLTGSRIWKLEPEFEMPHEIVCYSCDYIIARSNGHKPLDPIIALAQVNYQCPNCKVKLTLKGFTVEVVRTRSIAADVSAAAT